jgi:hypothetical protein
MSSIIVNNIERNWRKIIKASLAFSVQFWTEISKVDKSLFLAPPLRATSCNVHYSGSILYDNERETLGKSISARFPAILAVIFVLSIDSPYMNNNKLCCESSFEAMFEGIHCKCKRLWFIQVSAIIWIYYVMMFYSDYV